MDYSIFFRLLIKLTPDNSHIVLDEVIDRKRMSQWLAQYQQAREQENANWQQISLQTQQVNPKYILRNYLAHEVIVAAEQGDYLPFRRLLSVLNAPFDEHVENEQLALRAPDWGKSLEVSCSS